MESRVAAGARLLVIGEFVPPSSVRPWKPPFGRFLSAIMEMLVDETLQRDADQNWNQLGFGCPSEILLVTDLDERRAKDALLGTWRRVLLLGVYFATCGVALFILAAKAWPGNAGG